MKKSYNNWNKEELILEIEKLYKRKKFGLVWEDKPEEVVEDCKKKIPILERDKSKSIKNHNTKTNIIIEGDNYHTLSVLNYTHKGKIDGIYIDPPYNTGSSDWKYNNNYVDQEDPYRHTKWISFIHNRLKITKDLLMIKRPGTGIQPKALDDVIGMIAAKDIDEDVPITWHDLTKK